MNREAIHRHIDAHLEDHIEHVQRWVQQPSVSWNDGRGVRECAALVAESYRALGCTGRSLKGASTPACGPSTTRERR